MIRLLALVAVSAVVCATFSVQAFASGSDSGKGWFAGGHPVAEELMSVTELDLTAPGNFCRRRPTTNGLDAYVIDVEDWIGPFYVRITSLPYIKPDLVVTFWTGYPCKLAMTKSVNSNVTHVSTIPGVDGTPARWAVISSPNAVDVKVEWQGTSFQ